MNSRWNLILVVILMLCPGCQARKPPTPFSASSQTTPNELSPITERTPLEPDTVALLQEEGLDPGRINCNSAVFWRKELNGYANAAAQEIAKQWSISADENQIYQAARVILGYLVRSSWEQLPTNNLGVMRLKNFSYKEDGRIHPVLLFRSNVTTNPEATDSCFRSLLSAGHVRHVVNLYYGAFPLYDFITQEEQVAQACGASYQNEARVKRPWRELVEEEKDYEKNLTVAMKNVADLINQGILRPNGQPPTGNILVHCGGGMHRTGMIVGILRRCINQDPMPLIEQEYKRHVEYISEQQPGGYETLNLRFIRDFDCSLLSR